MPRFSTSIDRGGPGGRGRTAGAVAGAAVTVAAAAAVGLSAVPAIANSTGTAAATGPATPRATGARPTVVLVHGAFEDGSAWAGVTRRLQRDGYRVVVPAVGLRGVRSDSRRLVEDLANVPGRVVLVGHSYGGMVVSQVAAEQPGKVAGLVFVNAFIPKAGESLGQLNSQFPGTSLGPDTTTVTPHADGDEISVRPESFRTLFAADSSAKASAVAAASQRPALVSALGEPAAQDIPAVIPRWAVVSTRDRAIPPAALRFMADRADAAVTVLRSSHDAPASHPAPVTEVIEKAARSAR